MNNQYQELQKMQIQQQVAQLSRQQRVGQRGGQIPNLSNGSLNNMQSLAQMQQSQFGNQQWMDPTQSQQQGQRGSFTGMNTMAMLQQQTANQAMAGMGSNSSQNALYWNLQSGKGSGGGLMDSAGMAGMSGSTSAMQALLQQNGGGMGMSCRSGTQGGMGGSNKNDMGMSGLGGNSMMTNQQFAAQQMQLQLGKSQSLLGTTGRRDSMNQFGQGGNNALLVQQQQKMLQDLTHQIASQGGAGGAGGNLMAGDRRSSANNMMNAQQLMMQQQRGSANNTMLSQMGLMQDSNIRGTGNVMQNQGQQDRKGSINSTEPISIASFIGGQGNAGMMGSRRNSGNSSLMGIFDSNNSNNSNLLMQQQSQQLQAQLGKNGLDSLSMNGPTSVDQHIFAAQQQQLMNAGMGSLGTDLTQNKRSTSQSLGQANNLQSNDPLMTGLKASDSISDADLGGTSVNGAGAEEKNTSGSKNRRGSANRSNTSSKKEKGGTSESTPQTSGQQSFLDGTFNGGWQSNADIPDRRRVIYSICKVIEQMRPDARQMSQKLPFMAKRLEEHLYRSAQTKEEYLDPNTLKKRLQLIAHGLEMHRSPSSSGSSGNKSQKPGDLRSSSKGNSESSRLSVSKQLKIQQQMQQLQQLQQLAHLQHEQGMGSSAQMQEILKQQEILKAQLLREQQKMQASNLDSVSSGGDKLDAQSVFGGGSSRGELSLSDMLQNQSMPKNKDQVPSSDSRRRESGGSKNPDPQKKKIIKQQQQRLLLLRHASKCKAGPECKVKFCGQMVSLWRHMKRCRDRDCETPHCLSSRCVLNHYRICKNANRTSTCEVCGPVMRQIKQQNAQGNEEDSEEGTRDGSVADILPPSREQSLSGTADMLNISGDNIGSSSGNNNSMTRNAGATNHPVAPTPSNSSLGGGGSRNNNIANPLSALSAGGMGGSRNDSLLGESQPSAQQLVEIQQAQQKLQQQHALLRQLQEQQAQLLEQQRQLQQRQQHVMPQTQQGQQLQQQQVLLQKLQQQFQQQQLMLQQELIRQSNTLQNAPGALHLNQLQRSGSIASSDKQQQQLQDGKTKRRTSQSRKHKSLERQLSGITPKGNMSRRPGGGKGKRLSALETKIAHGDHDALKNRSLGQMSFDGAGSKRSADEVGSSDSVPSKAIKLDGDSQAGRTPRADPDVVSSKEKPERVLEQGDADHTTSLIPSMSPSSIQKHLESLQGDIQLSPKALSQKCLPVLRRLLDHQYGWVFRDPVDPDVFDIPDYFDVVKNPMHLALIEKKLENAVYKDFASFDRDTRLVFDNAILYNGEGSEVGEMAKMMLERFVKDFNVVLKGMKNNKEHMMADGDICTLCNNQRRLFQPSVLYCSGACGMQKIRRNSQYYTDRTKTNNWCVNCFELLKDEETITLDDGSEVKKRDLQKKKNDAVPEEAWVQCDSCDSWVHQICALFNGRKNKSAASYLCPKCHLKRGSMSSKTLGEPLKTARDLPQCEMSRAIEKGLEIALAKAYVQRANETGKTIAQVEKVDGLTVRVISNMEKKHLVRDEMFKRYERQGCPSEYPVRSKCIALFQEIHGIDVILFGMYVFEYNQSCAPPNRRRVYISYLDSVQYFQPKCYRTLTYHAVIVEYLRYVKERGFHTAHIWSCPPAPGDDYIFHCHPSKQQIPRDDMLRSWYYNMLDKAKQEGIVLETKTLYDEYFKNNGMDSSMGRTSDPTCLPYFEGDYIPGELENIIKDVNAEEGAKTKLREGMPSMNSKSNKIGKKVGTRSNPGELVNVKQDKVMMRLGQALVNMKHNFIVVHLRSRAFAAAVERGDDVSGWVESDDIASSKRPKLGGKSSPGMMFPPMRPPMDLSLSDANALKMSLDKSGIKEEPLKPPDDSAFRRDDKSRDDGDKDDDANSLGTLSVSLGPKDGNLTDTFGMDDSDKKDDIDPLSLDVLAPEPLSLEKALKGDHDPGSKSNHPESFKPMDRPNKRGFDDIEPALARFAAASSKRAIADTSDPDEPQEVEMFESRQQFLCYCQKNHFQFDELRRAKHTTMMVLFQLHNPNAPKFVTNCGACYKEIVHGKRYRCGDCADFDLCSDCYKPVTNGEWAHRESRFQHDKSHVFIPLDAEASADDQKNREERRRQVKLHLELLQHTIACDGSCSIGNCQRMKKLIAHVKTCDVVPKKACKICTRVLTLLTVHARMCGERGSCPMPYCDRIREKMNRRRQQQQLMDDRRRQAQNQLYRQTANDP